MKQPIKEEDGIHEQWYTDAKEQTLETLPEFLRHLTEDYGHDYGTICHALAAGITGFQAGAIMWEYMKHWNNIDAPARLVQYGDMLYPQYKHSFEKTIPQSTWEWLQKEATEKLQHNMRNWHPEVVAHIESIVQGTIPFGYTIEED